MKRLTFFDIILGLIFMTGIVYFSYLTYDFHQSEPCGRGQRKIKTASSNIGTSYICSPPR